jgi:uncharacterized cupin superfamily protein
VTAETESKGRFGFERRRLARAANGERVACNWYEVPPGQQAYPHHFHTATEESVYILDGKGAARIANERIPIAAGDYITFPTGPSHAHSIINTSDVPLRYLCISTVEATDVVIYPDSKKIMITAHQDVPVQSDQASPWVSLIIADQPSLDYYEGESAADESP